MSDKSVGSDKGKQAGEPETAVASLPPDLETRLMEAIERVGGKDKAAEIMDKSEKQVRRYLGGHEPPLMAVASLAEASGLSLDWIVFGRGEPIALIEAKGHFPHADQRARELMDEFVLVPRYDIRAAAGGGSVIHSEQIVDYLAFKSDWVRHTLRVPPSALLLIEAMGDSMEDTISDGDLLLVNTSEPRIKDNAIYALSVGGDLIVKRIQRRLDGTLIVKSDNARYDPEEVPPHMTDQLRVIGQVIWHGGLVR